MVLCKYVKHEMYDEQEQEYVFIIPVEDDIPNMEKVLCLSDTSLFIWDLLEKGKDKESILSEMRLKYGKEDGMQEDLEDFLSELISQNFLQA